MNGYQMIFSLASIGIHVSLFITHRKGKLLDSPGVQGPQLQAIETGKKTKEKKHITQNRN